MGFLNGFLLNLLKSPEIRSLVNRASKYFHVLIYDRTHNYNLLVFFLKTLLCLIVFFKIFIYASKCI